MLDKQCLPALIHGSESVRLTKHERDRVCNAYDRAFMKIFATTNIETIRLCQFYSGNLPLEYQLDSAKCKFVLRFISLNRSTRDLGNIFSRTSTEIDNIMLKYGITPSDSNYVIKLKLWHHFERSLKDLL